MHVSNVADDILITYSLGSCIGLTLYDPVMRIGGMIHCMLPHSQTDKLKSEQNPCMFVDTGVTALLRSLFDRGAVRKNLIAKIAGGSNLLDDREIFKIGERNHTMVRKILWKNDILIRAEDVGGSHPRTMSLQIADGKTFIRAGGADREL
jgi:chemotaxis protein CheD